MALHLLILATGQQGPSSDNEPCWEDAWLTSHVVC